MCPARWVFSNVMFCVRVFMAIACVSHIPALEGHAMAPEFKPEPLGKHPVKGFPSFPSTVLLMIFTHESSGAISKSGFPMSSLNMQVFFAFITCMSWDIWIRLCILRVLSMSSTFAPNCGMYVAQLYCHSASPLVGQNIVQKCTTHKGTGALTPRPMSPYCRSESTLQNYKGSSCKRQPAVRYAYMTGARETHTGQLWTQRQCSSIHSKVRMSLLMMNLPTRWMMRNCTSLTKTGFIRFVLCFCLAFTCDVWCPQTVA